MITCNMRGVCQEDIKEGTDEYMPWYGQSHERCYHLDTC